MPNKKLNRKTTHWLRQNVRVFRLAQALVFLEN